MSDGVVVRQSGEGEKRWFYGGGLHVWKATAAETGGAFIMFEDLLEQGKVTPWHDHPASTEAIYVLEGELLVKWGDQERTIGAGGYACFPKCVAHALKAVSERVRLLLIVTPGSAEAFYKQASEPVASDTPGKVDFGLIRQAAQATGVTQILGPPPFKG